MCSVFRTQYEMADYLWPEGLHVKDPQSHPCREATGSECGRRFNNPLSFGEKSD